MPIGSDNHRVLNRRSSIRVPFRATVRFTPNPTAHLRWSAGVSQNISLRGLQFLSSTVLDTKRPFELWISMEGKEMIQAKASVIWMSVEDTLGDSPYWIRSGVALLFHDRRDKELFTSTIARRSHADPVLLMETEKRIGFVF